MKYVIRKRCAQKITTFYRNVSKKYKHTYSQELMEKNVLVTVVDACHAQNIHDVKADI